MVDYSKYNEEPQSSVGKYYLFSAPTELRVKDTRQASAQRLGEKEFLRRVPEGLGFRG